MKFIQEYLNLHDQFNQRISNNTIVSIHLLKKTYKFSEIDNKIHDNLQVVKGLLIVIFKPLHTQKTGFILS